jgi:spermidine/putrescine transport system ATP-binding protein
VQQTGINNWRFQGFAVECQPSNNVSDPKVVTHKPRIRSVSRCVYTGQRKKLTTHTHSPSSLVQLTGLGKGFDGKNVISDFNLTINHGEFITLLGPSGCGKTTVLRLIAGLESVDSGHIRLDDRDITDVPAEHRHVNTVFQSYALFPHMTVFENVAFGLRMQKTPAADITPRVTDALRMVQLDEFAQRKPHQLSGGQQQRVAIARAVVNKPRLLLLDESLSALDYKLRKQMQNELKALQRKLGITFVFVTHDQEEALTMSDRIVVMRDGKIEQDGTPREIYEEPKNLFVASFIGEINNFVATVVERLDHQRVRANVEGRECNIYVNFAVEKGQQLHVLLRPEDLRVEEIHDASQVEGLVGYVRERNYKGMTLESVVELENGKMVLVSEFFNEDDPDFDHSLNQKMAINWVESWEVVLADEEHK